MGWRLKTTGDVRFDVPEEVPENEGPGIYPTKNDALYVRIGRLTSSQDDVRVSMQNTIDDLQGYIDEAQREIGGG
jgi:hypothetical protein